MKSIAMVVIAILVLGGATLFLLSSPEEANALGAGVPAEAQTIAISELSADPEAYAGREVTVKGTLAEVCPTTGCWGFVEDGSGSLRWDSKAYGWALPPGQRGKQITVRGVLAVTDTGAPQLTATGARLGR